MPWPGAPRPLTRMRWPSSTPAGIRTLTERTLCSVPVPWQTGHGVSNSVPRPMQSGQTVLREKRPWLSLRLPVPPQRGQVCVDVPGAAPEPAAVRTAHLLGHVDRRRDAVHRVLEGQVQRRLHVGTALGAALRRARAPAATTEETPEEVAQVAHVLHAEGAATGTAGHAAEAADRPVGADLVVLLALLGVTEDVVGGADLLEALLRSGVGVGVELLGQLPVGARDLLVRRRRDDAEHLVVVLLEPFTLCGHWSVHPRTRTMAGRSTCPFQR